MFVLHVTALPLPCTAVVPVPEKLVPTSQPFCFKEQHSSSVAPRDEALLPFHCLQRQAL
jgi:hypothetical protein